MRSVKNTSNMDNDLSKQRHFREANKRLMLIKNFYMRLCVYCTVNIFLFIVWMYDPYVASNFWIPTCFFTTVVAGLLVMANAINLYGKKYILPKKWEERKLKELMENSQSIIKYE